MAYAEDMSEALHEARRKMREMLLDLRSRIPADDARAILEQHYKTVTLAEHEAMRRTLKAKR